MISRFLLSLLLVSSSNLHAVQLLMGQGLEQADVGALSPQLEYDAADLQSTISDNASDSFSMSYMRNSFVYSDKKNAFERTYRKAIPYQDTPRSLGILSLAVDHYLLHSYVNFSIGTALGVAFDQGKGMNIDSNVKSDTKFSLWSVPFDVLFGVDLNLTSYVRASLRAGPSVMALIQTRDDMSNDEHGKNFTQFSYGEAAVARVGINLSALMPSLLYSFYSQYNVSRVYLNIEGRQHAYSAFKQEDIKVSGTSIGAGFSFDYF